MVKIGGLLVVEQEVLLELVILVLTLQVLMYCTMVVEVVDLLLLIHPRYQVRTLLVLMVYHKMIIVIGVVQGIVRVIKIV
tara:strand:+ start:395 stop:634 length:240 start_codon:yes stop_codon:yes gene_type:complete